METHPGTWIAKARSRAGMSQRQLAEQADVSPTTVRKIEHGEIDPHEHTLGKIYNVLGWPSEQGTDIAALSGRWDQLTDEERQRVIGYVDALLADHHD